jgi:hypothetical protein
MKQSLLLFVWIVVTLAASAQDIRYGRVIAMQGNVTIDGARVMTGQEFLNKNSTILIPANSYITLISPDGNIKTYDNGKLKVQSLPASMRPVRFSTNTQTIGCGNLIEWSISSTSSAVIGDTVLVKWKTKILPPFELALQDLFGEDLAIFTTESDSIFVPIAGHLKKDGLNAVVISIKAGDHTNQLLLKRMDEAKNIRVKRELAEIAGAPTDHKALRMAVLASHDLFIDLYYQRSLLSAAEIAALSPDLRNFILKIKSTDFNK